MIEPVVIPPVSQRDAGDCAICCLAMLLEVPYDRVMAACTNRTKALQGLSPRQMQNVAQRLKRTLVIDTDMQDLDECVGILCLTHRKNEDEAHVVLWMRGVFYNPADGDLWTDLDAFCKRGSWDPDCLLRRTK